MKIILGYVVPAFIAALAIPMALGVVPPNATYGFRTPLTLSSPDIWYRANKVSGWLTMIAMLLTIGVNFAFFTRNPEWPEYKLALVLAGTLVVSLLLDLAASLLFLRY